MPKRKKHPRRNIVCLRVTDPEFAALAQCSNSTNKSISDLMREALYAITLIESSCRDNNKMGEIRI